MGSAATIVLGLALVHKYQTPAAKIASAPAPQVQVAQQMRVVPAGKSGAPRRSLAVLPIENFSADAAQDYLAKGLTELLTAAFAERSSLAVISRTSTMHLRSQGKTLPEIAKELCVDLVMEGSVVQTAGRVRVVAQLIDGRSDEHIWARTYERSMDDVLAAESDIAGQIAREVDALLAARPHSRQAPPVVVASVQPTATQ